MVKIQKITIDLEKIEKSEKMGKNKLVDMFEEFFSTKRGHSNQKCMHKNGFHKHVFQNLRCFS